MATDPRWPVPELTALDAAFPVSVVSWMPPMAAIPDEFKNRNNEWAQIASAWFFNGLPSSVKFYAKPGVDPAKAMRALGAALGSFEPKHEHKEAAVAFLLSCWFDKVKGWKKS